MNQLELHLSAADLKWNDKSFLFEKRNGSESVITYGSFLRSVRYLAAGMIARSYSGKHIGVYGPNSVRLMICDVAVMDHVGLSVGISAEWQDENLIYAIEKCDIEILFYDDCFKERIEAIRQKVSGVNFLSLSSDYDQLMTEGRAEAHARDTLPVKSDSEPAKVVFTGGTTSFPKAVLLSFQNMFSGLEALKRRVALNETDVVYLFLPLHHTYGLIYNFLYAFAFGYEIHLCESVKTMVEEIGRVKPTVFSAVPLIYERFAAASLETGASIDHLLGRRTRYLFCGGTLLPVSLRQTYLDGGLELLNAYALSETASAFSIDYPGERDLESAGTIFEELDVKVVSPDEDGYGQLAVKGENVFLGYYRDELTTRASFDEDGYFLTGDIGCIRDNRIHLRGRIDGGTSDPNGEKRIKLVI